VHEFDIERRRMNVFFDVQGTLVGAGMARPHIREVFEALIGEGHHVYIWSSAGSGYARRAAEFVGVDDLAFGYFSKAEPPPVSVDFTVDDHPAMVETFSDGHLIKPFDRDPNDAELLEALREIRKAAE
jgi:phosphoglycolate phosphatase-like HAD superfamily hydrolase